jgi:hypothetical protein
MTTSKGSTFNRHKGVRFQPSLTHGPVMANVLPGVYARGTAARRAAARPLGD